MDKNFPYGLGTALITPFRKDMSIDYDALDSILDRQIAGGVDYIVVLGTTAEAATMTADEKRTLRQHIVQRVNGQLPLVLGVGGNNTAAVCQELDGLGAEAEHYAAILSVCPYYNKPNQEGLYRHFGQIAEHSPIPVLLYNVPGRTGVNLLPETVMRIYNAHPEKIIGIKEASGNEEQVAALLALVREQKANLSVISGDDGLCYQLMQLGAVGLISVASNAFPADFAKLVHEHKAYIQAQYEDLIALMFKEGNPVGIKNILHQMGLIEDVVRLPLAEASAELSDEIREALK